MKKCPKISRPAASSLKDYITNAIKKAPRVTGDQQRPDFLPSYTALIQCFEYLDMNSRNPGKKLESVRFIDNPQQEFEEQASLNENNKEDTIGSIDDLLIKPQPESIETPVAPRLINHAWQDKQGEWHWKWMSQVSNMFTNLFRQKRQIPDELEEEEDVKKPIKKHFGGHKEVSKTLDAKNNFIRMLYDMNKVVQLSCPVKMKPSNSLSRKALLQLASWAAIESQSLIHASRKYFGDDSLISQVHECLQSL